MATKAKSAKRRARRAPRRKWSARVTRTSDALTLEQGVFTRKDPRVIARSLKRSADASKRRKGTSFQSAMSMLTFYINRAGDGLSATERRRLDRAKDELRAIYGRDKKASQKRKATTRSRKKRRTSRA